MSLWVPGDNLRHEKDEYFRKQVIRDVAADIVSNWLAEGALALEDADVMDIDPESLSGWIQLHSRAPKDSMRSFNFRGYTAPTDDYPGGKYYDYRFQRAILDDRSLYVVVRKAAQLGISEIMARLCLAWLNIHKRTIALYVLPTKEDVQTFSDSRIRGIIEYSPRFRRNLKGTDNQQRKQIGDSFLIIRGGWEYRQAQMVNADFLILDEFDRLKETVVPSFEKRLSGSMYKFKRAFSTPQDEGKGIDGLFKQSDQKYWFDVCWSCNHEQIVGEDHIRKFEEVDRYRYAYHCQKCNEELSPERRTGIWKPTTKSELGISGYHVSQFMSPTMTAQDMVIAKATALIKSDYENLTLGLPSKAGLSEDEMGYGEIGEHNAVEALHSGGEAVMAIDWGYPWSWAEISIPGPGEDERMVTWIECFYNESKEAHWRRMIDLALKNGVGWIVADAGWGQDPNEQMSAHFPRKFWTIMTNSEGRVDPGYLPREQHIIWGKIRCFKSHYGVLRQKRVWLPRESPDVQINSKDHMKATDVWIHHHKTVTIRPLRDDNRVAMQYGAVPVREEIVAAGPIHLVAVSAYADVMWHYVRNRGVFEERRASRQPGFRARIVGGRR